MTFNPKPRSLYKFGTTYAYRIKRSSHDDLIWALDYNFEACSEANINNLHSVDTMPYIYLSPERILFLGNLKPICAMYLPWPENSRLPWLNARKKHLFLIGVQTFALEEKECELLELLSEGSDD